MTRLPNVATSFDFNCIVYKLQIIAWVFPRRRWSLHANNEFSHQLIVLDTRCTASSCALVVLIDHLYRFHLIIRRWRVGSPRVTPTLGLLVCNDSYLRRFPGMHVCEDMRKIAVCFLLDNYTECLKPLDLSVALKWSDIENICFNCKPPSLTLKNSGKLFSTLKNATLGCFMGVGVVIWELKKG